MTGSYKICTKTIMDTTADPDITFDNDGVSNYVAIYDNLIKQRVPDGQKAKAILEETTQKIKADGRSKEYDCILGVSGGVDSTYTAYYVKKVLGLRPLAVHVDNGWNSELAVKNIEKTLKTLDIDLYTCVINWEEFRHLQVSFLKASIPDAEVPTENVIWASLYKTAAKFNIRWMISGTNIRTEGILPQTWSQGQLDWRYLKSIHHQFENTSIRTIPKLSLFNLFFYIGIKRIKKFNLLDYIDYNKSEAVAFLEHELGWEYYGGKHYESVFTRFFQGYLLPEKFSIDKRRGHLSSLVCSGEITREEALVEIKNPPYPDEGMLKNDLLFVKKKLNLSDTEFTGIMKAPIKSFQDYPNNDGIMKFLMGVYSFLFHDKKNKK